MKNFIAAGRTLDWTNTTGSLVPSGSVVVIGNVVGVATMDANPGDTIAVQLEGVFSLTWVGGTTAAQGVPAYWDNSAKKVIAVANTTSDYIGTFYKPAASGDATAQINLVGSDQPGLMPHIANLSAGPTQSDFNNLLAELQNAGFMARS